MSNAARPLILASPDATAALARRFGTALRAGDTLLLQGDIGAGKSYFARALIQSLQDIPEDVPSPTFTLVQTYDTRLGELWHADLYRLGDPGEVEELGLTEALTSAICLIEWPDRLGTLTPSAAAVLTFNILEREEHRSITLTGQNCDLMRRLSKAMT